jgi:single-strand DNA-binding protein
MSIYPANQVPISTTQKVIKQYLHEVTGKLHLVEEVNAFDSGFRVRRFVIMTEGYKPEPVVFQLVADMVDTIEGVADGSLVKVVFSVKGREWEGKYFNNLEAKSIEVLDDVAVPVAVADAGDELVAPKLKEDVPF